MPVPAVISTAILTFSWSRIIFWQGQLFSIISRYRSFVSFPSMSFRKVGFDGFSSLMGIPILCISFSLKDHKVYIDAVDAG